MGLGKERSRKRLERMRKIDIPPCAFGEVCVPVRGVCVWGMVGEIRVSGKQGL